MVSAPELKKYTSKKILITLNNNRQIQGILIGFDIFLNLNLTECVELSITSGKGNPIRDAVKIGSCVIRGNSVVSVELIA
ncbi:hypothetical protein CANARDRAFT_196407 [[Candida] arabinofermentans NRRL YB-2248]|uniref:Sm protein G n=1 Tax=[Candida] arabinofermentans NRRL YB-2248 TaxID=983967 RepID=A0A1E4T364_9ASCO|nr:hypothetical protein CANARDRAFT_196407 [[Candida] arabinofermentans NRRL YB-2248]